jgi:peptide methionine sulfoxide reductase MsrA
MPVRRPAIPPQSVKAVRVAYDDKKLSYAKLLDNFHECQKPGYKRQYASVVFMNKDVEGMVARLWKEERRSAGAPSLELSLSYKVVV